MTAEEIYNEYANEPIEWMQKHNVTTTREISLKLMEMATKKKDDTIERLAETIAELEYQGKILCEIQDKDKLRIQELEAALKEMTIHYENAMRA